MTAYLNALGLVCALGRGQAEVARKLFAGDCSGMRVEEGWVAQRSLPVAAVHGELPELPAGLQAHQSRNNQLLLEACLQISSAIEAAIARFGRPRIGIVLGTSTSASRRPARASPTTCASNNFRPATTMPSRSSAPRPISLPTGCN